MALVADVARTMKEPLDVDAVLDESQAAADKVQEPGGHTQENHLAFLLTMAKVGALDNKNPKVKKLKKEWGKLLRDRREERGVSLRAVARKTYVDTKTVSAIENGTAHISRYPLVYFLFEAYMHELDAEKEKAGST